MDLLSLKRSVMVLVCIAYRLSYPLSTTGTIFSYIVGMVADSIYVPWVVWLIATVHHGVDKLQHLHVGIG